MYKCILFAHCIHTKSLQLTTAHLGLQMSPLHWLYWFYCVKSVELPFKVCPSVCPKTQQTYLLKSNVSCCGLRLLHLWLETSQDIISGYKHFPVLITRQLNYLCLIELGYCVWGCTLHTETNVEQLSSHSVCLLRGCMVILWAERSPWILWQPQTTTNQWRSSYCIDQAVWSSWKVDTFAIKTTEVARVIKFQYQLSYFTFKFSFFTQAIM